MVEEEPPFQRGLFFYDVEGLLNPINQNTALLGFCLKKKIILVLSAVFFSKGKGLCR
jgi:hypothetical protein